MIRRVATTLVALLFAATLMPFDAWAAPNLAPPAAFNCPLHVLLGIPVGPAE